MSYPRWLGTSTLDRVAVATNDVLETSSLDLMLVRLAALAAVDAPTAS
jgi:hypothetical protein